MQTSGSSVISDLGVVASDHIHSDKDDIYAVETELQKSDGYYNMREADISTVDAGLEYGVKAYVVIPPTICE